MSEHGLQSVIGTAIVDRRFRDTLLENPLAALRGFELTVAERRLAGSIRAASLEEYAGRLEMAMTGSEAGRRYTHGHGLPTSLTDLAVAAG